MCGETGAAGKHWFGRQQAIYFGWSRSAPNEKGNFAVLRKVDSSSLPDEDGLGWGLDGQRRATDQMDGNLHHPGARPGSQEVTE